MTDTTSSPRYCLLGRLKAMPRRRAAQLLEATAGILDRRPTRNTTVIVVGLGLLDRLSPQKIVERLTAVRTGGREVIGERAYLRRLGQLDPAGPASVPRAAMISQSGLSAENIDLLALFGAFECDVEPFTFQDLLFAKQYARLIAAGTSWCAIARSINRSGRDGAVQPRQLRARHEVLFASDGVRHWELDGQMLLGMEMPDQDPETWFSVAEEAEESGDLAAALHAYGKCLALDPDDADAAFNRANCLREMRRMQEAEADYIRALKADPQFVEAWFNLGDMLRTAGRAASARRYLQRVLALDPGFADAAYNLAAIAFDEEDLEEAATWWRRYLEHDQHSEWAEIAKRGLLYISRLKRADG